MELKNTSVSALAVEEKNFSIMRAEKILFCSFNIYLDNKIAFHLGGFVWRPKCPRKLKNKLDTGQLELFQRSMVGLFVKIINGFQLLTFLSEKLHHICLNAPLNDALRIFVRFFFILKLNKHLTFFFQGFSFHLCQFSVKENCFSQGFYFRFYLKKQQLNGEQRLCSFNKTTFSTSVNNLDSLSRYLV